MASADYRHHLRRLALHDDALFEQIAVSGSSFPPSVIDARTEALVRVAAAISIDAAPASFQQVVTWALAAGATPEGIVASLEAVTAMAGASRVVKSAPKVALALGYDIDAALEELDH